MPSRCARDVYGQSKDRTSAFLSPNMLNSRSRLGTASPSRPYFPAFSMATPFRMASSKGSGGRHGSVAAADALWKVAWDRAAAPVPDGQQPLGGGLGLASSRSRFQRSMCLREQNRARSGCGDSNLSPQ